MQITRRGVRAHPVLAAIGVTYLIGFTIYGLTIGAAATIPYAVVVSVCFVLLGVADHHVGFTTGVLAGLCLWGFGHMAGGLIPVDDHVLYGLWLLPVLRFDQLVHVIGFGLAALAAWQVVRRWLPGPPPRGPGLFVTVVFLGMGVGAINEVVEFFAGLVFEENNVGGYLNTSLDLVADLVGSIAAAFWVTLREGQPASSSA